MFGLIATFLGIYARSILSQVNGAFQIRAVAGMVFAGQPFGIVPFWPGCGTGLIVLVVLTLCNGKKVSDDYALYKSRMDAVPAEEL